MEVANKGDLYMIVENLKVFVTVSEQKNFSRAAELLNLSQPGVSLHIRNLENELGAKLMHRSPKQVKLTEAGHILYQKAKKILALYDEARRDIQLLQDTVTGSIHVGASFTIGEYLLPRLLAEFVAQYPQVELQVTIGNTWEIVQKVRKQELHLGLVEGTVTEPGLTITPYMKDELLLVAAPDHPLCEMRQADVSKLHHWSWILRESGSGTRAFSDRFLQEHKLEIKRTYVFNSSQGVKEAVAAGLGLAILSRWVVRKELESGSLQSIPLKGIKFTRDFSTIQTVDHSPSMAIERFLQQLMEDARRLRTRGLG